MIATGTTQLSVADLDAGLGSGECVVITVSDTGAGMTRETAAKAFEPFFTTKHAGEGSGLGLAQVHGFIKQSGGQVRIRTEIGIGTTLELFLPCLQAKGTIQAPATCPVCRSPVFPGGTGSIGAW